MFTAVFTYNTENREKQVFEKGGRLANFSIPGTITQLEDTNHCSVILSLFPMPQWPQILLQ